MAHDGRARSGSRCGRRVKGACDSNLSGRWRANRDYKMEMAVISMDQEPQVLLCSGSRVRSEKLTRRWRRNALGHFRRSWISQVLGVQPHADKKMSKVKRVRRGAFATGSSSSKTLVLISLLLLEITTSCRKSTVFSAPSPALAAAPMIEFSASPNTLDPGEPAELRWSAQGATTALIDHGIGEVSVSPGSRRVFPMRTTTYKLIARGPAGSTSASLLVSVVVPAADAQALPKPLEERLAKEVQDVYFDFDKSEIRDDARATLAQDATALTAILRDFAGVQMTVEGHCDDMGQAEYNLELGYRRAELVKRLLEQLGVPGSRLKAVTRGEMSPLCAEASEACRAKNRRVHVVARSGQ